MRYSIFLLLLALNWGCTSTTNSSTDQPTGALFPTFYVRYLQAERQLKAEARFLQGDSAQIAKPVAMDKIFFDGGAMEQLPVELENPRYKSVRTGEFKPPYQFEFEQGDYKNTYSVDIPPIDSFTLVGPLSLKEGGNLQWSGSPLSAGESIVILISDAKGTTGVVNLKGPHSNTKTRIEPSTIKKLTVGDAQMYLVRKKDQVQTQESGRIVSSIEFYSDTKTVRITE